MNVRKNVLFWEIQVMKFFHSIIILFALAFAFLILEAMSAYPNYELRPATIIKVTEDEKGFINYDKMTIVKFEDGYVGEVGGDKGNVGDKILAYREVGIKSAFGIFGDKKILK